MSDIKPLFGKFFLLVPGDGFVAPETWDMTHFEEATVPENSTLYQLENVTAVTLKNKGNEPTKRGVVVNNQVIEEPMGDGNLPPRGYSFETDVPTAMVRMLEHASTAPTDGTGDFAGYDVMEPMSRAGALKGYGLFIGMNEGDADDADPERVDIAAYYHCYLENDPEAKGEQLKYTVTALKKPSVSKGTVYQKK